jgi:hypothetical protein
MSAMFKGIVAIAGLAIVTIPAAARAQALLTTDAGTLQVIAAYCGQQVRPDRIEGCTRNLYMLCSQKPSANAKADCIRANVR